MELASLRLTNFRSCRDTSIDLASDLTVLVGENASGKSAVIDAIRLSTYPSSGRATAWFTPDRDLNRHVDRGSPVTISARYGNLTEAEKAIYLAELVDTHDDLIYNATFATASGIPRRSMLTWSVGGSLVEDPEPALRRRVSHVYLPPLRDAVRDIDSGEQTQLHEVLRILIGSDEELRAEFVDQANAALGEIAKHPLANQAREAIESYFIETTPPNREHRLELNQRELELRRISRLLRLQLAEHDIAIGHIASTGLGYANLLYISMIVLQLARADDSDLTLLLVEEPEAHLHPQLQLVLLDFLQAQARKSGPAPEVRAEQDEQQKEEQAADPASGDPEEPNSPAGPAPAERAATGRVQVIVTTHSPVLASTVSVEKVVVVARSGETAEWCTKTTALARVGLSEADRRKVDRYLNSTRAALLFARDVVLVEGIAEMLLIPALAEYHLTDPAQPPTTRSAHRRQFRSATIVSVEGVDFEPYLRILLTGYHPRVDRVVVVTDGDNGAGAARRQSYQTLFADAAAAGRLHVVVGGTTLEAEVFRESPNEQLLRDAFEKLHPASQHHWDNVVTAAQAKTPDERAETFAAAIRAKAATEPLYLDIGKGDFAHLVAEAILADKTRSLVVPPYLRTAIELAAHVTPPAPTPPTASAPPGP